MIRPLSVYTSDGYLKMTMHPLAAALGLAALVSVACQRSTPGAGSSAEAPPPAATTMPDTLPPLVGTEWSLIELDGQPAPLGAGEKPATLSLTTSDGRASGFAGCNRWSGTYERSGDQLRFGRLISTKMACSSGMELEQRFLGALEKVRSYAITLTGLELRGDSTVLARLGRR